MALLGRNNHYQNPVFSPTVIIIERTFLSEGIQALTGSEDIFRAFLTDSNGPLIPSGD